MASFCIKTIFLENVDFFQSKKTLYFGRILAYSIMFYCKHPHFQCRKGLRNKKGNSLFAATPKIIIVLDKLRLKLCQAQV